LRRRRVDERRARVHEGGPRPATQRGRPPPAAAPAAARAPCRARRGDRAHQRPHPRLRPREQRLLLMTSTDPLAPPDTRTADAAVKADTLIQSLPWLRRFAGRIIVVKFGGNAMVDEKLQRAFAEDMVYLRTVGLKPVVVHGG